MEPLNVTREWVARQLVEKHEKALSVIEEEFERYSALEKELDAAAESFKNERDKLNESVQTLKEQRQNYYTDSRDIRKEFMTQMQKKKSMADIPMEVLILTKQIDQFEWEIQTEAVNVDDEKKLVKHIQDNLDKLHEYANKYQEHEEVSKAVRKLTSKLNKKLQLGRKMHEDMLKAVDNSDEQHKKFVDAVVKLRDARARRIGFQHDMERHQKSLEHWQKVAAAETNQEKKQKPAKQKAQNDRKETNSAPKPEPKPSSTSESTAPKPEDASNGQ